MLHKNGIILNTGSDTYEPGKAILSEMLLFNELGIPMNEVLKITSLNSARSMNMDISYGSIEVGKKAQLILFDENPLLEPLNLLSKKTVIKDGYIWKKK
ncbi:amidohydrolase family protein [Lutimonas zeaxanthinifaciens]|uniref:amidohydrolase family protein n=1 Tax=Lutimonas zeaxanthinifaciens TaxID=3060215 RepID=UPI00265D2806|nr:amidohydrolase family protein [Lutimonas sp. YSD2104]WKK67067.1 amidohydrolase family protein [Lutimonas sp. YSD2104]